MCLDRRHFLAAAFVALLSLSLSPRGAAEARPPDNPQFDRVAAAVADKMKEYGVPGVSLAVLHDGQVVSRGFGVTSVEHPLPVTDDTLFQVGSISKTFTGTLVMRLVEQGKLGLEAPVRTYIPAFRVKDEQASREATMLTTLTHMGGWEGDLFIDTGGGDDALTKAVAQMADQEQIAPFNTVWSYNNAGFYVASRLVEIATGKTYEQALQEMVLTPLGLKQTFIHPSDVMTFRFAVGHGGPSDKLTVLRPWHLPRALHGVGGVTASVKDLVRYGQFHLGDGTANGARVLSQATLEGMQASRFVKQAMDEEMAVTWHITNAGGLRQVSHSGSTTGQQALLVLVPARRFAIAMLTNSGRGGQLNRDVSRVALQEFLGATVTDPVPVDRPPSERRDVVGRYSRPYQDVIVALEGSRLMIQTIPKQGFPSRAVAPPPPAPATPYAFYAKDRLIGTDGPTKLARAEIIRRPDGSIGWLRIGGRVARRVEPATTR